MSYLRSIIRKSKLLREFVAFRLAPSGLFDNYILNRQLSPYWKRRLHETIACPDNKYITSVKNAGTVNSGIQIMHNGQKIYLGSYYGPEVSQILFANNGIHEPQEERIFQEVLKVIPDASVMIEMGSFWSFYSMWFQLAIPGATNYMIEPEDFNLKCGKRNFRLNSLNGFFTKAYIGKISTNESDIPVVCVDDFMDDNKIDHVGLLHSDIQGFEYDMLLGAEKAISAGRIDYIFISTHSNKVHYQCLEFLNLRHFSIKADINLDHTYSEDGLIVAAAPHTDWEVTLELSRKI